MRSDAEKRHGRYHMVHARQIPHGPYMEGEPETAPLLCVSVFEMEME